MMVDPDPYIDFWTAADFKHPAGHSMRLVDGLRRAKRALDAQGALGRMSLAWMKASAETR